MGADELALINVGLFFALTPLVVALVELAKGLRLRQDFAPVAALVFGVALAVVYGEGPWRGTSLTGIAIGLSASGLYSGVKAGVSTATRRSLARRTRDR